MPIVWNLSDFPRKSDFAQHFRFGRMRSEELPLRIFTWLIAIRFRPGKLCIDFMVESDPESIFLDPSHAATNPAYIAQADFEAITRHHRNGSFCQHAASGQVANLYPEFHRSAFQPDFGQQEQAVTRYVAGVDNGHLRDDTFHSGCLLCPGFHSDRALCDPINSDWLMKL